MMKKDVIYGLVRGRDTFDRNLISGLFWIWNDRNFMSE